MRKILALAAGAVLIAAPAAAQQQSGLVNVNVSDIEVELERIISDNNITAQVPVNAIVSVPIGIATSKVRPTSRPVKSGGATPTIGKRCCNSVIDVPSTSRFPPNRDCQKA